MMKTNGMKLSAWAKSKGLTYRGAYRIFRANQLPCRWEKLPTGTIIVFPDEPKVKPQKIVAYVRVLSRDQKEDLKRQILRLRNFASANDFIIADEYSEIGSGLEGRPKLLKILQDDTITHVLVESEDKITRLGFNCIVAATSKEILVVDEIRDETS